MDGLSAYPSRDFLADRWMSNRQRKKLRAIVRFDLQIWQEIGVMTDHFPFATFFAEDVRRADGDSLGLAFDIGIFTNFVILHHGEVAAHDNLHSVRFDGSAEFHGGLFLPY